MIAWVVGSELNGDDTVLQCPFVGALTGPLTVQHHCDSAVIGFTVEEGECEGHHTVVGSLAVGDITLTSHQLLGLAMGAVAMAFLMGMAACACCVACCAKKTPYKHLNQATVEDASDVEAVELNVDF